MSSLSRCGERGLGGPFCDHVARSRRRRIEGRSKERAMLTWDILNNLAIMATNSRRHLAERPSILPRCDSLWFVVGWVL